MLKHVVFLILIFSGITEVNAQALQYANFSPLNYFTPRSAQENSYRCASLIRNVDTLFWIEFDEQGRILDRRYKNEYFKQHFYSDGSMEVLTGSASGDKVSKFYDKNYQLKQEIIYRNQIEICRDYNEENQLISESESDADYYRCKYKIPADDGAMEIIESGNTFQRRWIDSIGIYAYEVEQHFKDGELVYDRVKGLSYSYYYLIDCISNQKSYSLFTDSENYYTEDSKNGLISISERTNGKLRTTTKKVDGSMIVRQDTTYGVYYEYYSGDTLVKTEERHHRSGNTSYPLIKIDTRFNHEATITRILETYSSSFTNQIDTYVEYAADSSVIRKITMKYDQNGNTRKEVERNKKGKKQVIRYKTRKESGKRKRFSRRKKKQNNYVISAAPSIAVGPFFNIVQPKIYINKKPDWYFEELVYIKLADSIVNTNSFPAIKCQNKCDTLIYIAPDGILQSQDQSKVPDEYKWLEGGELRYGQDAVFKISFYNEKKDQIYELGDVIMKGELRLVPW